MWNCSSGCSAPASKSGRTSPRIRKAIRIRKGRIRRIGSQGIRKRKDAQAIWKAERAAPAQGDAKEGRFSPFRMPAWQMEEPRRRAGGSMTAIRTGKAAKVRRRSAACKNCGYHGHWPRRCPEPDHKGEKSADEKYWQKRMEDDARRAQGRQGRREEAGEAEAEAGGQAEADGQAQRQYMQKMKEEGKLVVGGEKASGVAAVHEHREGRRASKASRMPRKG